MSDERTHDILHCYFQTGELPDVEEIAESKKEMNEEFEKDFKALLKKKSTNPVLAFQVLYHRMAQIADVAKSVFYDPAIEYLKENDSGEYFGAKVTLKTSDTYNIVKSPKIIKLEREIKAVEKKNESTVKAFEKYNQDLKSLKAQIKAEEDRLIKQGLGTKKESSHTISLSY